MHGLPSVLVAVCPPAPLVSSGEYMVFSRESINSSTGKARFSYENSISKCNFADEIGKFVFSEPGGTSPPCPDGKNYLYCLPTKVDIYESFNQRTKIYYLHNVAKWLSTK